MLDNTITKIDFDTEIFDTGSFMTQSNNRFTVPSGYQAGKYLAMLCK